MTKDIIVFGKRGFSLAERINLAARKAGIEPANVYCSGTFAGDKSIRPDDFARRGFAEGHALIFIGAAGIAVRTIAPYAKDKLADSPVIVIDDGGTFVIPILSGHARGANKLAATFAHLLDAIPVITTSTDVNEAFSADVFAAENRLTIHNREGIKKVNAKAIEGKIVTISVKDYPPVEPVDIIIADETDREYSLLLKPKRYIVGLGAKRGIDAEYTEKFVLSRLADNGIDTDDVYYVATLDVKADEAAFRHFCDKYRIPLVVYEAAVLQKTAGEFDSSEFVRNTVGVDNVCERAAACGGELFVRKIKGDGITLAISRRRI